MRGAAKGGRTVGRRGEQDRVTTAPGVRRSGGTRSVFNHIDQARRPMRYDANEITDGITEVLAYGTAVVVQQA